MPKSCAAFENRSRSGQYRILRGIRNADNARNERRNAEQRPARENDAPEEVQEIQINAGDGHEDSDAESDVDNQQAHENDSGDSDVESDDELEDDEVLGGNIPLYRGAEIAVQESMLLVLTFMLNHNLTSSCLEDLLALINLHCPRQGLQSNSLYKFKKFFSRSQAPMIKEYYCSQCRQSLANADVVCAVCGREHSASFFVRLPLIPQLREMYKRNSFYNDLQHKFTRVKENDNMLEDIYDGAVYKEQIGNGFLANQNNISFTWYTDGAPVFNSRNYSIWPFFLIINELPYRKRVSRENILFAGLWFGPVKPVPNLFMRSFVPELRKLHQGVNIATAGDAEQVFVRGMILAGVCDTPAKSAFLNTVGHQGFYGCPVCEIRGETLRRADETDKHVYPYQEELTIRTIHRVHQNARQALETQSPVMGIKGPTVLRLIIPNFLRGIALDPMHLVTGVVKKLLKLHFNADCGNQLFSVRALLGLADNEFKKIRPPKFIHRRGSSLEEHNRWKASELKTWFFYYSVPIYKSVLRPAYFNHYLKLVTAISYLSSSAVHPEQIDASEELLKSFVKDFQELYDLKYCSINIHMLLHLPQCVRELGPLWVYSCFPMEDLNGRILDTVHGKTDIDTQVCNGFWRVTTLPRKLETLPEGSIRDFCLKRMRSLKITERIADSCHVVGNFRRSEQHPNIILQGLRASNVNYVRLQEYFRLLKNGIVYVAERYGREKRSQSSFVAFQNGVQMGVGSVLSFVKVRRCECHAGCPCASEHYAVVQVAEKVDTDFSIPYFQNYALKHIFKYRLTLVVKAIPVSDLVTVCFCINVFQSLYIAQPVNMIEVE